MFMVPACLAEYGSAALLFYFQSKSNLSSAASCVPPPWFILASNMSCKSVNNTGSYAKNNPESLVNAAFADRKIQKKKKRNIQSSSMILSHWT